MNVILVKYIYEQTVSVIANNKLQVKVGKNILNYQEFLNTKYNI
jgi:hypothetical protein